jgi:hypothetical protein
MKPIKRIADSNGSVTFIAVMMMVMLTMIGVAAIKLANDEITIAGNEMNETMAFYAAESGLERAAAALQTYYEQNGQPPASFPAGNEQLTDATSAYVSGPDGAAIMRKLDQGTLAGLNGLVQTYTIRSIGTSLIDAGQVTLTQAFEVALVPLFQFAVFYDNDLEIAPGPDMILNGRVHTNGNLWLQAGSDLYIDSYVTAAGDVLHGRKGPEAVSNGDILIKDASGNYQNMKNDDDSFLSAADANWYDSAAARWGGKVQDESFGQEALNLPLTNEGDPHKLIERSAGNPDSYENIAAVKIIDGNVQAKIGNVWTTVNGFLPAGVVTTKTFYDGREGTNVNTTEIDVAKFSASAYYPSNGVVYFSDSRSGFNAVRLVNGSDIGKPLSFYSENPIYVKGDFNSINKRPAALAGDAVTFLSNSWDDAKSTLTKDSRIATPTIVHASILTGNTNTTNSNYNGGLENLPRFLEVWSGVKFTYSGSMVNLWNSVQADGLWSGVYYSPPDRDWSYDTDLNDPAKLPPMTPTIQVFQRTGWQQENVGYSSAATTSIDIIN